MTQSKPSKSWWQRQTTLTKASIGGGAVCIVLTLAIFGPGGLLSGLTSPSEIEETTAENVLPDLNQQEAEMPAELSKEKNEYKWSEHRCFCV